MHEKYNALINKMHKSIWHTYVISAIICLSAKTTEKVLLNLISGRIYKDKK